ncbi:MAG TPA: tetratricopeptide repeat protein [Vicinamibacterales bacterium]|nr:tetratricopeptide repeat protein [Vicinamibacterales bacterium]
MARWPVVVACVAGVVLLAPRQLAAQGPGPKQAFTGALARFSLALDGAYGDEGPAAAESLSQMERVRQQWDSLIRTYETGLAAEVGGAPADVAARMHLALAGEYLERHRFRDAQRELAAAITLDPNRPEALTVRGLIEAQLTAQPREALDDLRRAAALTPHHPVRAYLFGRQLLATADQADSAAAALERFVAAQAAAGPAPDGAPFVRLGLVDEVAGIEPFFPPAPYRAGYQLLAEGRYEDALTRLKTAAATDPLIATPPGVAEQLRQAGAALRNGDTGTAVSRLESAVAAAPGAAEAHRLLGLARLADDDTARGVTALRQAIGLDATYERPRIDLARALFAGEQFGDTVTVLTDTLAAIPDSGRARYLLALAYQRQGDYDAAMTELGRAAALEPLLGLNSVYQTLGALRRSQQDYAGAIDAFSRRVALVPNDPAAHHELAEMYFRIGRLTEALAEFTAAVMIAPTRADSHAGLAQVRLREGRFEAAAAAARRAVAVDPAHKEARYVLATSLLRLGQTDEGTRELEVYERLQAEATALQSKRLELGALRRDATVSTAAGDHDRAVALLRKALDADPGDPQAELELGLALLRAGKPADALPHLRAGAADAAPDVHLRLAEAYAATGQIESSRRERALYAQARQDALRRAGAAR